MYSRNLGELQSILVGAQRCLDCRDPHCITTCPEHVDVQAAMRLILHRGSARPAMWTQDEAQATQSVMRAIEASFR